jgi:hypothetical protein
MRDLLDHDVTNTPRLWHVLLSMAAPNFKTSESGREMRLFVRRSGKDVILVCRWMASLGSRGYALFWRVSSGAIPSMFGHCFGAYATPGGRLALLLCYAPSGLRFPSSTDPP